MKYILALDQGTSSSRCILFDQEAKPIASAQRELSQHYPKPGWVEHDPIEIWQSQAAVCRQVMQENGVNAADMAAIGITNQRETTVIWERSTGKPIYNAIVWQDRRTADHCDRLKTEGMEPLIKAKTGLVIDAYFSATKICWLLDHVDGAREKAERGELAFGTIDSWLVWNLTNSGLHITDVSNASRTQLFNIDKMAWDNELLALFDIPAPLLPEVKPSGHVFGQTATPEIGIGIPIAAILGDQQAGLFGQLCWETGMTKCTYGTGSFVVMNTGKRRACSQHGLLSSVAWQINDETDYVLEGGVFVAGAAIQWLRDGLGLFGQASECEAIAASVSDNGGVYFVPALTGLGAPHWDSTARGAIFGLTRGTTSAHLIRAAIEAIAFQVDELLQMMATESGMPIRELRIDGGVAGNNLLAQFQADLSAVEIVRPGHLESTSQGIAYLAGVVVGLWTITQLNGKWQPSDCFSGQLEPEKIGPLRRQWLKAVARTTGWQS